MPSIQPYTSSGGRKYYRIVESYRDKATGKPKIRLVKHLGTAERILEILEGRNRQIRVRTTAHGDVASLLKIAEELDIAATIDEAIARDRRGGPPVLKGVTPGQTCILIAIGRACRPTSKCGPRPETDPPCCQPPDPPGGACP